MSLFLVIYVMRFISSVLLISWCSCRYEFGRNTPWKVDTKVAETSCELQQIGC